MPWKEVSTMTQKIQLLADWHSKLFTVTDLSHKYDIQRNTVYKWLERYEAFGVDGLKERSRAPHRHPNQTPDDVVAMIVAQKLKKRKRGPKKVIARLKEQHPDIVWPSPSTASDWLKKHGLVGAKKKRSTVPPYTEPFKDCHEPNASWSADYKGQFYTRNGRICYPLTISYNYSRYLLACTGLPGPRYHETRAIFETVFREYGLPDVIRTDNGTPFAGKCIGGLSRLAIWWIQLGIMPERIDKGRPQQNSRHERMHRTMDDEALEHIAPAMKEQQREFDFFRTDYNDDRPHEALGQKTPASVYKKSPRPFVEKPVAPEYDHGYTVRQVRSSGDIKLNGNRYFLTELLEGHYVGLKAVSDELWQIYYSFYPLGFIDIKKNKVLRTKKKVFTMCPV